MTCDCHENLCCCISLPLGGIIIGIFNLVLDSAMEIFAVIKLCSMDMNEKEKNEKVQNFHVAMLFMAVYWMVHIIASLIYLIGVQFHKPNLLIPLMIMMMLDAFYWLGMEGHDSNLKIDPDLISETDQKLIMFSILIKIAFTLYFVFVSRQIYDHFREEKFIRKLSVDREGLCESTA